MDRRTLTRGGLAALLVAAAIYVLLGGKIDLDGGADSGPSTDTQAQEAPQAPPEPSEPEQLPIPSEQEAQEISRVLALVEAGGPFPHEQDGTTFQNREGRLPQQPVGYYKEYTCETPGSDDRGARRLVIGQGGETYYTADHYETFTQIDPEDYR